MTYRLADTEDVYKRQPPALRSLLSPTTFQNVRCPFHARDRKKSLDIDISEIRRNIVWL